MEEQKISIATLVGMKSGIKAFLQSCEDADAIGMLTIEAVRLMAEHQIETVELRIKCIEEATQ